MRRPREAEARARFAGETRENRRTSRGGGTECWVRRPVKGLRMRSRFWWASVQKTAEPAARGSAGRARTASAPRRGARPRAAPACSAAGFGPGGSGCGRTRGRGRASRVERDAESSSHAGAQLLRISAPRAVKRTRRSLHDFALKILDLKSLRMRTEFGLGRLSSSTRSRDTHHTPPCQANSAQKGSSQTIADFPSGNGR